MADTVTQVIDMQSITEVLNELDRLQVAKKQNLQLAQLQTEELATTKENISRLTREINNLEDFLLALARGEVVSK